MPGPLLTVLLHGDKLAVQQARLGAALSERGHRVIVCEAPLVAAQIRDQRGAPCEEVHLPHRLLPARAQRWWMRRRVRSLGVDVVHLNFVRPAHQMWSRMEDGPPYVATAWGSDLNDEVFPKDPAYAAAVDHVLAHASALTADSAPLLDKAKRRRGGGEVPAAIVLWGVDLTAFAPARAAAAAEAWRARLDIAAGRPVVLSPRQPGRHYHVDRILRAFAESRYRREGVLVIKRYGRAEQEGDERALERLAAELGLASAVRFAPPCGYAELPGLYAIADVAVSALEVDGVPSTFCELLSLGVPLIATDLPAYRGLFEGDRTALLVPPGDHGALVAALDRVAGEPDLSARLRAAGMAFARDVADFRVCVDGFEAVYRAAMARHAGATSRPGASAGARAAASG